jgi:hypothetical protein
MDGDAADAIAIPDAKSGNADTASQRVTDGDANRDTVRNADTNAIRNADTHSERHSDTYSDTVADSYAYTVVCVQRETARKSGVMHMPGTDVYR